MKFQQKWPNGHVGRLMDISVESSLVFTILLVHSSPPPPPPLPPLPPSSSSLFLSFLLCFVSHPEIRTSKGNEKQHN